MLDILSQRSRATVLYRLQAIHGARQNSTLRNFVLIQPIITKLGVIDYIGDPY